MSPDRLHHSGHDEDEDEDEGEGELLYRDFLSRRLAAEMEEQDVNMALYQEVVFPQLRYPATRVGPGGLYHQSSRRADLTSDFSNLAERFERSGGREEVRRRADMVDISSISQDNLTVMLTELFQDGVTQERLLVLFFFCSDLALRALRAGLVSLVSRLTDWVVSFIRSVVTCLVRCRGGWQSLLSSLQVRWPNHHLTLLSLSAALIGLGALYIKKHS